MGDERVAIGRPGDLIWPGTRVDAETSYVGGQPWYPAECGLPQPELVSCSTCSSRLLHILHVCLPPEPGGRSDKHTSLYLFTCVKEECAKGAGTWRALRCQWTKAAAAVPAAPVKPQAQAPLDGSALWGFGAAPVAGEAARTRTDSSPFDFSDLEAALDAMTPASASTPASAPKEKAAAAPKALPVTMCEDVAAPCLPGFYLGVAQPGRASNGGAAKQRGGGSGGDVSHLSELIEKFEQEKGMVTWAAAAAAEAATRSTTCDEGSDGAGSGGGLTTAPEVWEGEGYEKDTVLAVEGRSGVGAGFLKFMRKLQPVPDQCSRHSRGRLANSSGSCASLLWPGGEAPAPRACPLCGSARGFAVQLMAPTIAALEESVEWLEEAGCGAGVEPPPTAWDWATAAVFVCRELCVGGGGEGGRAATFMEEEVAVARED